MISQELEANITDSFAAIRSSGESASSRNRTWQWCWRRQREFLDSCAPHILPEFLAGAARLQLPMFRLPDLSFLANAILPTGWSLQAVEGFIPSREYLRIIAERRVPISHHLRSLADAEHSPQPDMLHDIFGHLPILSSESIMKLTQTVASAAIATPVSNLEMDHYAADLLNSHLRAMGIKAPDILRAAQERVVGLENLMALEMTAFDRIRKIYLWAMEFGVLNVQGRPRAFGAGLISSRAELARFSSGKTPLLPFDERIFDYDINFIGHQNQFFLIENLDDVYRVLDMACAVGAA